MNKQQKIETLKDILGLLDKQVGMLSKAKIEERKEEKPSSLIYSNPLSLLVNKNNVIGNDWRSKIKSSKIMRAAKNLMLLFDSEFSEIFDEFFTDLPKKIESLNEDSELSPAIKDINTVIDSEFNSFIKSVNILIENYISDTFNSARQHQVLFNNKISLKKFLTRDIHDIQAIEESKYPGFRDLFSEIENFKYDLKMACKKIIEKNENKSTLIEEVKSLETIESKILSDYIRKAISAIYHSGNAYQLKKDEPEFIRWKTSQDIDTCPSCRAIQMGDKVFWTEDGENAEFNIDNEGAFYKFSDIKHLLNSPSSITHEKCRCNFIPRI